MMEIITYAVMIIIAICIIGLCGYKFFKMSKEKRIAIILEWLLLAVVKAEKELGDGTGQLKLRFVYDMFIDKLN